MCQVCEKMKGDGKEWRCAECGCAICLDGGLHGNGKDLAALRAGELTHCEICDSTKQRGRTRTNTD